MPMNYLLTQDLRRFYQYYGGSLKEECPTGSGQAMNLDEAHPSWFARESMCCLDP
jgi:hypothetical protein